MNERQRTARKVARGLGWFSIALGVAELMAPRAVARATGMRRSDTLMRAYGLREIGAGIGLLTARDPTPWLWARMGGDALDLATLAARGRPDVVATAAALAAVAGVTAVDAAAARVLQSDRAARRPVRDYSDRSGLPLPPQQMRGAARLDFAMPEETQGLAAAPVTHPG